MTPVNVEAALERAQTRVRLDWSDPSHWSPTIAECRRCATATQCRDEHGRPIHQACAEEELGDELLRRPARRPGQVA